MTALVTNGNATQSELEFQEKLKERIRQGLGDLMPDAVLAGIVARGIEEAFFKPQRRPSPNQWSNPETYPSWLVEYLEKEVRNQVQLAVTEWIAANHAKVTEALDKALAKGLASAVLFSFDNLFRQQMETLQDGLRDQVVRILQGR